MNNPFKRLTELTATQNNIEDALQRQPRMRPGSSIPAPSRQTTKLTNERDRAHKQRGKEIGRLLDDGHSADDLRTHLDKVDRHRNP